MTSLSYENAVAVFVIFISVLYTLYLYVTRNFKYWEKKGIPYMKPLPFVGNLKEVVTFQKCIGLHLQDLYNRIKAEQKPYKGIFLYDQPVLMVTDLNLLKQILLKDFEHFMDKGFTLTLKDKLLGQALFIIKGQKWKWLRTHLSPGFSTAQLKHFFKIVDEKSKIFETYFDDAALSGQPLPVKDIFGRFTTDIVAAVAFGIESNALENPEAEFRRNLKYSFLYSKLGALKLVAAFVDLPLFKLFPITTATKEAVQFFQKTVHNTINERKTTNTVNVKKDYLDLLIQIEDRNKELPLKNVQNNGQQQYPIEVVSQAYTFLSAGFETTSSTIMYSTYHLALDQNVQSRLRQEIQDTVENNDGQITYETIQYLPYLDMVVTEILRLYPTMSFVDRTCTKPYRIPGSDITIDKGVFVYSSILGIQRDPDLYPNPDHFDPERFSSENKKNRHRCAYMPFGEGPRICIGKRFGIMVVKNALSHILLNYQIHPCSETPTKLEYDVRSFLMTTSHEIPLVFKRIK